MFSLAEYERMDNDIVVEKLLVVVHQAISDEFPNAAGPSQQFKKTVFSSESTVMNPAPEAKNQDSNDSPYADIPRAEESNFQSGFENSEFPSNITDPGDQMQSSFEQGIDTVTNSSLDQIAPRREMTAKKFPVAGTALFVGFVLLVLVGIYLAIA